jgi:ribosomal protein S18 acetylase RimI-like enzyme
MSRHQQERLREIALEHPADAPKFFQGWASDTQKWQIQLYTEQGFEPVRYGLEMTRPCSEPMTPSRLPKGIEVHTATKKHIRQIWDAQAEAFQDHWGFVPPTEENFEHWQAEPTFQPEFWRVAWKGDEVAGMVLNFINHEENKEYNRLRGYTENISVWRPWRRQGVARSLLTQSIKMFQEMDMEETCLGVDTKNPNEAKQLYESVGYKETKCFMTFRKPME